MSRELYGYAVWGPVAALVLVGELLAIAGKGHLVPWPTLSETVGNLIVLTNGWMAIAIVAGLNVLQVHLIFPGAFDPHKIATRLQR